MDEDLRAEIAISRLQRAYADISTRNAWPEFAALATPDAQFSFDIRTTVIEVAGAQEFADFSAKMTDRFSFYEYVPLNHVVEIDPAGTARGRAYSFEIGEERASGELVTFFGLYHDDYARVDSTWLFSRRRYQTLARRTGDAALESFPLRDRIDEE